MTTPILNIPEVSNGQVNQYLTYNQALRDLEGAGNDVRQFVMGGGNVTITNDAPDFIFSRYAVFKTVSNAVPRILIVPAAKRLFIVWNGGTSEVTVNRGAGNVAVAAGTATLCYTDGTTNGIVGIAGGSGASEPVVDVVAVSSGVLNLSSIAGDTVKVLLTENVTSITYPAGIANRRRDLMIRFEQDATGGRTVDLSGIVWDGGGSPPVVSAGASDVTYITATNVADGGWEGFK